MMELMDTCDENPVETPEHTTETGMNTPVQQLEQAKVPTEDVSTFQPLDREQEHPPESSVPFPQRGEGEEEEQTGGGEDWPTTRVCHTHERAISMQDTVEGLDITEEGRYLTILDTSIFCHLVVDSRIRKP